MKVSAILRRKGTHVEQARPHTTVAAAAQRLTQKGVGSLVVFDGSGRLRGVLSERDIVRAVAERGPSSCTVPVGDLLAPRPATCEPEDSLRHVLAIMTRRRTRHLPVLVGGELVGIVSIGDVVKGLLEDLELEVGVLRDYARARA